MEKNVRFVNDEKTIAVSAAHYLDNDEFLRELKRQKIHVFSLTPTLRNRLAKNSVAGACVTNRGFEQLAGGKLFGAQTALMVAKAAKRVKLGKKIVITCPAGAHASPAMAAAVLMALGKDRKTAIETVCKSGLAIDKPHISTWVDIFYSEYRKLKGGT